MEKKNSISAKLDYDEIIINTPGLNTNFYRMKQELQSRWDKIIWGRGLIFHFKKLRSVSITNVALVYMHYFNI